MIIGVSGYSGVGKDAVGAIIQYLNCKNPQTSVEEVCKNYLEYEYWLEEQSGWEVKKFAGKLKDIASHLTGIDIEDFEDQDFKKTNLSRDWWTICDEGYQPMTVRDFLQKLGTDALRNGLHPNVWVNALMADYKHDVDINTYRYAKDYTEDRIPTQEERVFPMSQLFEYLTEVKKPNWIITDTRFVNEAEAIKQKGGIIIRVERPGYKPINDHPSETALDKWNFDYKIQNLDDIFALKQTVEQVLKHAKLL